MPTADEMEPRQELSDVNNQRQQNAPPTYSSDSTLPSYSRSGGSILHTLNGTMNTSERFLLYVDDAGITSNRTMTLVSEQSEMSTNSTQEYFVCYIGDELPSGFKVKGMEIRRYEATGSVITRVMLKDQTIVGDMQIGPHHIVLKNPTKSRSSRDEIEKSAIFVEGLPQFSSLRWIPTNLYLHSHKGKGKAGDAHLIAGDDTVLAIFLNQWDGHTSTKLVGGLHVMEAGMEFLEIVVASLVAIAERNYKTKDTVRKITEKSLRTALLCSIM